MKLHLSKAIGFAGTFLPLLAGWPVDSLADAYWAQPWQVKQCTGNGTRQYAAQLMSIPGGKDWKTFCQGMPAEIGGQRFEAPTRCLPSAGMWGEFDGVKDDSCLALWGPFAPGSCIPGARVYSSRLWNVTGDWDAACRTTPASVAGRTFGPPELRCVSRGAAGMWGEVDIPDGTCGDVTFEGTIAYEDGSTRPRAFTGGTVEVWACGTWVGSACSWSKIATTRTDVQGSYRATVSGPRDLADRYVVRVVGENAAAYAYAQDTKNLFYADLGPEQLASATSRRLVFNRTWGTTGNDLFVARHLNAVQKLQPAKLFAERFRDSSEQDVLGKVAVWPSVAVGIPYTNSGQINVNPNDMDPGSSGTDPLLLHEYAHFLQESIGAYYLDPRVHSQCQVTDPQYAWFEGFHEFFQRAVRLFTPGAFRTPVQPVSSFLAFRGRCSLSGAGPADSVEGVVADVLFVLLNDGEGSCPTGRIGLRCVADLHNSRALLIMNIFDKEFDFSAPGDKNLKRFRDAWNVRGGPQPYLDRVYAKFRI